MKKFWRRLTQTKADHETVAGPAAPLSVERWVESGDAANRARNWPEAERSYREALALDDDLTAIWVQLGHAVKEQGRVAEAEAAYRVASEKAPDDADAFFQLGHCLKLLGRVADAREAFAQALQNDPRLADARQEILGLRHLLPSPRSISSERVGLSVVVEASPRRGSRTGNPSGANPAAADGPKKRAGLQLVRRSFDEKFYRSRYMTDQAAGNAFDHYLTVGCALAHDARADFDERLYRTLYPDIKAAIALGSLISGFEHWLVAGEREGRIGAFDLGRVLETMAPGVTRPTALDLIDVLEAKLTPCPHSVDATAPPRVWFVMPLLNPDLMFGGFASMMNLIDRMIEKGIRIGIFLREGHRNQLDYFVYRMKRGSSLLRDRIGDIRFFSPRDEREFIYNNRDVFVSYSIWDSHWARKFAEKTLWKRPIYWIQEYEPIFHKNDSISFIANSAYHFDHIGIFNSKFLLDYFVTRRIGVYGRENAAANQALSYEHLLWHSGAKSQPQRSRNANKTLFLYARPEDHAARNLFEIAIICLRRAIADGSFVGSWRFVGTGSLAGPYVVDLGGGMTMKVTNRMPADEYARFISEVDIGVSLMYAPHPSLLPFELARSGAIVITNAYETRGEDYISGRSKNIIVFEPTIEAGVAAIKAAVDRVAAGRSSMVDADDTDAFPDTRHASWKTVFNDGFLEDIRLKIGRGYEWPRAPVSDTMARKEPV